MRHRILLLGSALLLLMMGASVAVAADGAADVGYYRVTSGQGTADQAVPVSAAGHTPVLLTDLTAADLASVDVLFIDNPSNGSYAGGGGEFLAAQADIEAWIASGGVMIFHDRYVTVAETVLPGGETFNIIRDFSDDSDIDVLDGSTLVTNGPGGVVDNTTLDGGTSSSHGFAVAGTLPDSSAMILSRSNPDEIVTFSYCYGSGGVVYSSIPLDYYLAGFGPALVRANFAEIYAPNVVAYGAEGFCEVEVDVDIKPGSDANPINLKSKGNVPVAVLSTADFDASTVDVSTVTLGNDDGEDTSVVVKRNGTPQSSLEDVDGDGDLDLVLHFSTQALVNNEDLEASSTTLTLRGQTGGGQDIVGADFVNIVSK